MGAEIEIGIIGCGMVSNLHIQGIQKSKDARIRWVCDIQPSLLKQASLRCPTADLTNNYLDVLSDSKVDAIIIATPPHTHVAIAKAALERGIHVLLEKPIATQLEDLNCLLETAAGADCLIMDCSARHSRLQPKFEAIRSMIRKGELGDVYAIHHRAIARGARPGLEYHPEAKWFLKKELSGGGPLLDWGVYDLSFHLGVMGDSHQLNKTISSLTQGLDTHVDYSHFDVEEHGISFLELTDGLTYSWERATHAHGEDSNITQIYGTKGGIKFDYLSWGAPKLIHYFQDSSGKNCTQEISFDMGSHTSHIDDFYAMDRHFIDCILGKDKPVQPLKISAAHLYMIMKIYENAFSRKVKVRDVATV